MAGQVFGVLAAGASRYLVSNYNLIPTPAAISYNLVDMALCALVSFIPKDPVAGILVSRVIGIIVGAIVTTALCGPIDLVAAVALNLTSFAVSMIMALGFQRGGQFLLT